MGKPSGTLLVLLACLLLWSNSAEAAENYAIDYHLDLTDSPKAASVSMTVRQDRRQLRRLRFLATSSRFTKFASPAGLTRDGDYYVWSIPEKGGTLSWQAPITHARDSGGVDARLGKQWALFRGEDAFPAMKSVALKGAQSQSRLTVDLPKTWTMRYAFPMEGDSYRISNPARRFDRPTGWIIAGDIGARFDNIAGIKLTIAAPKRENVRRQDMLALLNWTLPELTRVLPTYPGRVLIVSTGDPFWRGGLSGPASLYVHADRPLISENGTSTLLHEMFHVFFARSAAKGSDWIVEGLAEYYSVELLRRSGTVSPRRHEKTMNSLKRWGKKSKSLIKTRSSGATTARAVGVFEKLDLEIRERSGKQKNLDDVVRRLATDTEKLDLERLMIIVREESGGPSTVLSRIK